MLSPAIKIDDREEWVSWSIICVQIEWVKFFIFGEFVSFGVEIKSETAKIVYNVFRFISSLEFIMFSTLARYFFTGQFLEILILLTILRNYLEFSIFK